MSSWHAKRGDDFPPAPYSPNRALCCCCTCCCVCLIGAGVGLLTGTGFGIAKGIFAIGKFRREEMPRGWAAFMSGGGVTCVAFMIGAATIESAGLALLAAVLIGGVWGALCGYGKVTVITGIGLVIGYIVILGMLATAVGFGIGLAIDKAMGNF